MKIVYICSPLRSNIKRNIKRNIKNAIEYGRYAYKLRYLPIIPHPYTDIIAPDLKDNIPEERKKILNISMTLLSLCDEILVFGNYISDGMKKEIEYAKKNKIKIKYITITE